MGTRKEKGKREKPIVLERMRLALHLRTAATRYRNVNSFLRNPGRYPVTNAPERIEENNKLREEAIQWSMQLDPENTKVFIEKEAQYEASSTWPRWSR